MMSNYPEPNLSCYVDWIVFDRSWGTFSESCATRAEAFELAESSGGGRIYRRQWVEERPVSERA